MQTSTCDQTSILANKISLPAREDFNHTPECPSVFFQRDSVDGFDCTHLLLLLVRQLVKEALELLGNLLLDLLRHGLGELA